MTRALIAAAAVLLIASPLAAQTGSPPESPLISSIAACQQIGADSERLRCFDRAAAALVSASRQGEVAVVNREQVQKAKRSLFGFPVSDLPFFGRRSGAEREEEAKELATTLVSLSSIGLGRYRFTVEGGAATWETTEAMPIGSAQRGTSVTIRRGALGSYFVQIGRHPWVRARRIR